MKSKWWEEKAIELQMAADRRYMKTVYLGLKEAYGPKLREKIQLYDHD